MRRLLICDIMKQSDAINNKGEQDVSIRNAAKAVIIDNGKMLLNKCHTPNNEVYYTLPGGGQNQYETMEEAVKRECLEETGYNVNADRFLALYEQISMDKYQQKMHPDYTHKIFHIFLCSLADESKQQPVEMDMGQIDSEWIEVQKVTEINFFPQSVKRNIKKMLASKCPIFIGSIRTHM